MSSARRLPLVVVAAAVLALGPAHGARAQAGDPPAPPPAAADEAGAPVIDVSVGGGETGLTRTVSLILLLTIGSLLPALLLLTTSFTRFAVVLGLTRNALGIQAPPTPVLLGIAAFLTLFVMEPALTEVWDGGVEPLLNEELTVDEAYDRIYGPLREFMLEQTREEDLRLFLDLSDNPRPERPTDIGATVLVPAFVVSELRAAFLIGFVVFVPFLAIDLIVSTVLMALGMVMLPPTFISLPVKLLLFVLVDGWGLLIGSLVTSVTG